MARRRVEYSIKACEKWLAQGRGKGEKETYKPWVRIGEFSSRGVSTAIPGIKTKRVHELMSGVETRAFLVAEFNKTVIDIREQFPLFPLDHVVALAKQADITYPFIRGEPFILTTDLLLTRCVNDVVSYLAIAVKPTSELKKKSILDKLEIERLWWNSLGIDILSIKSTQELSESLDGDNFDKKFKRYIDSPISYVSKKKYHPVMDNYLNEIKDGISDLEGLTEKSLNFLLKKIEKSFKDKSKIRHF